MVQLIGGFSPRNFVKQAGSFLNPTGGVTNYDVFTNVGKQRTPQAQEWANNIPQPNPSDFTVDYASLVNSGALTQDGGQVGGTSTYNTGGGGGYGGGGGGGSTGPSQLQLQQEAFLGALPTSLENIRQTYGRDPFTSGKSNLQGVASNLLNRQRSSQTGIDNSRANNELNRMTGIQDILSYVRNGLTQGASRLANANATESSATGALGRAYNQLGSQKARGVNSQAGLVSNQLNQSQQQLQDQGQLGVEDFRRTRDNLVTNIATELRNKLATLDAEARGLSLPDRIAVDQEKQNLINAGQAQLQEVDQWLQSQLGGVVPQTPEQVQLAAQGLRQAGQGSNNPFDLGDFGTQVMNEQTPAISQMPLFTRNKRYYS